VGHHPLGGEARAPVREPEGGGAGSGPAEARVRFRGDQRPLVPPIVAGRVPPHDLDAEAACLSASMLDAVAFAEAAELLRPEHFYSDANGRIFEAARELAAAGTPVDITTIASWLRDRQRLVKIGGPSYLAQLADATPAVSHVAAHAAIVVEKWRMRQVIATCQTIAAEGYGDVGDATAWRQEAERRVHECNAAGSNERGVTAQDAFKELFARLDEVREGRRPAGIPTGYADLDDLTVGLHRGDVTVVAARPGMGKTAMALCVALNVAGAVPELVPTDGRERRQEDAVAVFSMEMPRDQISARLACIQAGVDTNRLRKGMLSDVEWRSLTEAAIYLSRLPLWIDDTTGLTLAQLQTKVRGRRLWYEQQGRRLSLVVVDYLQLMEGVGDTREQQISYLSRGLKRLAKDEDLAVIALSQLNRAVEARKDNRRPLLSDLRESGAIEQDADTILFLYRADYYGDAPEDEKGTAEIIVAKQRNGPAGRSVRTRYYEASTRFANM
jgi:replicative DNA helicase